MECAREGGGSSAGSSGYFDVGGGSVWARYQRQIEVARQIRKIFDETPGVVDVDWYVVADQKKLDFRWSKTKPRCGGFRQRKFRSPWRWHWEERRSV